jgi:hypothetical protein
VNERTTFRYFQFENTVEINTRTINNSWTVGSDSYVLADGFIRQDFFNGRPSEFNEWRAQGTLTRNGVQVGGIGAEFGELSIDIFLQVDNQREILYRHLRNWRYLEQQPVDNLAHVIISNVFNDAVSMKAHMSVPVLWRNLVRLRGAE